MPKPSQVEPERKRRRLPTKTSPRHLFFVATPTALVAGQSWPEPSDDKVGEEALEPPEAALEPPEALVPGQPWPEPTDQEVGKAALEPPEAPAAPQPLPEPKDGGGAKAASEPPEAAGPALQPPAPPAAASSAQPPSMRPRRRPWAAGALMCAWRAVSAPPLNGDGGDKAAEASSCEKAAEGAACEKAAEGTACMTPLKSDEGEKAAEAEKAPADLFSGLVTGTIRPLGPRRNRLAGSREAAPLAQQLPPKTPSAPSTQSVACEARPEASAAAQPALRRSAQKPASGGRGRGGEQAPGDSALDKERLKQAVGGRGGEQAPGDSALDKERLKQAVGGRGEEQAPEDSALDKEWLKQALGGPSAEQALQAVEVDLERASAWLERADALLVGSGAGMGVDAGLATFRGSAAWSHPGLEQRGLTYEEICDPKWFRDEPQLAWSFWESCHRSYQAAKPHAGYELIQQWANKMPFGAFSYTSNVDSHWLRSGWEESRLVEVHGAIRLMQCSTPCTTDAWATPEQLGFGRAGKGTLPSCPRCKAVARPSVMMFGQDVGFSQLCRSEQDSRYEKWLRTLEDRASKEYLNIVCLEVGCGVTVSTVRRELETVMDRFPSARLIRVNPEQSKVEAFQDRGVGLPLGALDALRELERRIRARALRRLRLWKWSTRRRLRQGRLRDEADDPPPDSPLEKNPPSPESVEDILSDSTLGFEPRRSLRIADRVMNAKKATSRRTPN